MIQQSKINSFIKSITDTAAEKRAAINAETEEIIGNQLAVMDAQAKKDAADYITAKSASIKLEAGRRISERAAECRKDVFGKRDEIAAKTLGEAGKKLSKFTQSEGYGDFLLESAGRILETFGSGRVTLLVRPEDMKFEELILGKYPFASVSKDETIRIGGMKGIDSLVTLLIDDTLDSRLENQKKWFEENSELYISMR